MDLGLDDAAGVLGMDVLSHAVVVYDLSRSRVTLQLPGEYELAAGRWFPLEDDPEPTIRMRFEGRVGRFRIDTGTPGPILLGPAAVTRWNLLEDRETRDGAIDGVAIRGGTLRWIEWGGRAVLVIDASRRRIGFAGGRARR